MPTFVPILFLVALLLWPQERITEGQRITFNGQSGTVLSTDPIGHPAEVAMILIDGQSSPWFVYQDDINP